MDTLRHDVMYALRRLRRAPGFAAVVVLTLALGIGATTSIFSVVYGVLGRALPFDAPEQLVRIHTTRSTDRDWHSLSPPNFASLREQSRSFTEVVAYFTGTRTLTGVGEPLDMRTALVGMGFFDVLGVRPVLGRAFRAEEYEPGAAAVVVLGHALWQRVFDGQNDVIDRVVMIGGVPHTIVGVLPAGIAFPEDSELWIPRIYTSDFSAATETGRASNMWVPALARLRPGVSMDEAASELRLIARDLESRFPASNTGVRFNLRTLRDELVGEVRTPLLVLLGAVGLVMFIACANVAALLLARGATQHAELAVRAALGAGRRRLLQQMLAESMVLSLLAGAAGLLVAIWGTEALLALRPDGIPRLEEVRVDVPVATFAIVLTLLAGVLVGIVPALRATRGSLASSIRESGRGGTGERSGARIRNVLVVAEIALAVILLAGAGLLVRSFMELVSVAPGFRAEQLLTFELSPPAASYSEAAAIRSFHAEVVQRIEAVPGVIAVGATSRLPIRSSSFTSRFRAEGWAPRGAQGEQEGSIGVRIVTPDYRRAMGIPLLGGRDLSAADGRDAPSVALINQAAAKRYFPDENPIGKRLVWFSWDAIEGESRTIVGIVGNVRHRGLSEEADPEVYLPHAQVPVRAMHVVARTAGDPLARAQEVRAALATVDPDLAAPLFTTGEDVIAVSLARPRFTASLLGLFAAVALILASVGISGLLAYTVAQRTREIGVRVALGARPGQIIGIVVGRSLRLVGAGLALGVIGALVLSRILESMLFGVSPYDPAALAAVVGLLGVAALAATLFPARRAASVDPVVALRQE